MHFRTVRCILLPRILLTVAPLPMCTGLIDEFRLWTYLRTEAEIYQDRDNTLSYTEDPNLLAYFQFNSYDSASMTVCVCRRSHGIPA